MIEGRRRQNRLEQQCRAIRPNGKLCRKTRLKGKESCDIHCPDRMQIISCSICLNNKLAPVRVLPCGHRFHKTCISKWSVQDTTCPLCRMDFMDQDDTDWTP
ncbi:MAG: hypothetical protein CL902_01115 [Dehalococcoidia bacterium]|nr:hypothetical protein [Dehalococcoidia bacterium]